ncbi:MAG: RDD family protein [Gammaproteobacteria bacterium]
MLIHVAREGRQSGPYSVEQVQDMVRSGLLAATDLGWHAGMSEWAPLHAIPELGLPPPPVNAAALGAGGPPADRFKRLVAAIIDGLLIAAATGLAFGMGFLSGAPFHWGVGLLSGIGFMGLGWLAFIAFQCYLLATRGQTIGKIVMSLRIVRFDDGGNPGFVKAVLLRTFVWAIITAVPFVGPLVGLIGILFIFRDDRRCLHDHLAGTRVVQA